MTPVDLHGLLSHLRVEPGCRLVVHAAMRTTGLASGELLEILSEAVGKDGTVVACAFQPVVSAEAEQNLPVWMNYPIGRFAEAVLAHPNCCTSRHPVYRFAAVGADAEYITAASPDDFPLGACSPLDRLYQLDARILLIGTGLDRCPAGFLAEAYVDAPYARRTLGVMTEEGSVLRIAGAPRCSDGFQRMLPVLRQARIAKFGSVGGSEVVSLSFRQTVSMAVEMLKGDPESLLCAAEACPHCVHARSFTRQQEGPIVREPTE
jgi:aminoglycoside N3'-acetyltransferase